jgi:hypothetical protein
VPINRITVPTHRDHPWERDARAGEPARSGPPAAVRQWAWALLAIAGVLAIVAGRGAPPSASPAATPTPPPAAAPPPERFGVLAVRSRALAGHRVLVWGAARSPVRASIGLRVHVGGVRIEPPRRVPLGADGLFESVVRIPPDLVGRPVDVKVDMYVGGGPPRRRAGVSSQAA